MTAVLLAVTVDASAQTRCKIDRGAILNQLDINPARISRDQFEIVYAGMTGMGVTGYSIWLQSDSCQGSVVINFDTDCRVIGTFPSGNCSLQSLRN